MPDDESQVKFAADVADLKAGMADSQVAVKDALDKMTAALQAMTDQGKKTAQDMSDSSKQMGDAFKGLQASVSGAMTGVQGAIAGVMTGMQGLVALLAGGALFKGAVDSTLKWAEECAKLSRTLGVTMESASVLNTGLRLIGSSSDTYISALIKLERQLKTNEDGLKALGLVTRDANGALVDGQTAMQNAISTIQQYKVGQDQNVVAIQLFGRGMQQMGPLLRLNDEIMARAAQTATTLGLKIGTENVEAAHKYEVELNAFKLVLTSINQKIGGEMIPQLDKLAFYLNQVGPTAANAFSEGIKVVIYVCDRAVQELKTLAGVLAAFFASVAVTWTTAKERISTDAGGIKDAILSAGASQMGDDESARKLLEASKQGFQEGAAIGKRWSETLKQIWSDTYDDAENRAKAFDERIKNLFAKPADLPKYKGMDEVWGADGDKSTPNPADAAGGAGSAKDLIAQYTEELQRIKDSQADLNAWSASKDYEFWNQKLATTQRGTDEWWAIWHKMADLYRNLTTEQQAELDKQAKDEIATGKLVAEMKKSDAETAIKVETEKLNTLFSLGQISAAQRLAQEQQLMDREYQAALKAQYDQLTLVMQNGNDTIAEQAKIYLAIEKLQNEHVLKMQKTQDQYLLAEKQKWDQYATEVGNALTGLVFKHQTMLQTMQNLTERAFSYIVDTLLKKLVNSWILAEAQKTGATAMGTAQRAAVEDVGVIGSLFNVIKKAVTGWLGGETAKTAATQVGVTTRTALETAGEMTAKAARLAANLPAVMADSAVAYAGTFAFLAPFMGPAAEGPAEMSRALVLAQLPMASLDIGAWNVPKDMFAKVHAGEMVVPASYAEGMRGAGGSGKGGGGDLHVQNPQFHFHGDNWKEGVLKDPGVLYKAIRDGIRDNHIDWRNR